ncbi:histone-lysine N-methyltransferase NSD2 isoform X2 [Thalassophryne amazonica]|uniref:histone-lysine N-methyltransferase NSD2 isoform X2 n=1 Tax=Thalassophryne amazonica TaxID=390379 RepID=UPI001470EBE6|nr:histone-lysine N-methyltransferase NSD2 isoform X2 [Thalassophryne amazonica]
MDSKGSSLPSMPEPANPVSMKQPPESLVQKARGDVSGDPALLMDKAAAQFAATLQDGILQKMSGHSHNSQCHERLKDLTSLVLNGDQDQLAKLCTSEPPVLKGAEAPATNGTPHSDPELKVTIPQVVMEPTFEPCCADETSLATEGTIPATKKEQGVKKNRGRLHKSKPQSSLDPSSFAMVSLSNIDVGDGASAPYEPGLVPELKEAREESAVLIRFSVGDLVWTKVSGYPWWPCMVTTDPELNNYIKQKPQVTCQSGLLYHVQYFGDAPERGYIWEKNMVSFTGEDQYRDLSIRNRRLSSHVNNKKMSAPVSRKIQFQWNMGIIQAKEAFNMSLDERMANFTFVYDEEGPHLNPHVLEKLKPEQGNETDRDTELQLSTVFPAVLISPADEPAAISQLQDDGPKGKKKQAPRPKFKTEWEKRGKGHLVNLLIKKTWKDTVSSSKMPPPQPSSQHPISHSADTQPGSFVPQKKKTKPKQAQSTTKTVKRRKIKSIQDSSADPVKKRKSKTASSTSNVSEPATLSLPGKRQPQQRRLLKEATAEESQQPNKRRKMGKGGEKQDFALEGTPRKQSRRRKPAPGKPIRKRKWDGVTRATPSTAKKRRSCLCPDTEGSGSDEHPDSPSDSLDGTKKGERKKECVCQVCEQAGEDLVACEGQCCRMFHLHCLGLSLKPEEKLLCQECRTGVHSCFTCKQSEGEVRRCHVQHCGRFYHEACARLSPLTVFDNKGFRCPLHTCLSCHYGCSAKQKSSKGRLMRCVRCPVAYHSGDLCVAAGSELITNSSIICTNHFSAKKGYSHHSHVNVSWCFVCSKGGQLLCCESCPAAFHPDCLNIAMPDGSWFCNDCRAGKKPKYKDIIWVKLGTYRWWPAEIQHPRNVPTNIQHLRHEIGEFPVFFFGSKDYFWTHQGRVFPYMEGDRGSRHQRNGIGKVFKSALLEAEARFKEIKMKREAKEAQENNRKPPPYKFIKVNRPFGKVQVYTADISEIPKCNCKPTDERPCGFESECLNRMLQYECHPQVCPSGQRCCNQDFTKRCYPETQIIKTNGKGWGLISLRDIKKGEFVNEYIGELIDEEECRARIKYAQENNITDFYMLTIDKDRIIDAGPKGNYSRFMNHSCQPNCETQKWTVNGDTRVGLFAVCDIPAGTELTFNYNLDCLGNEKTVCRCGAPNCSGFLGDRPKNSNGQTAELKAKRMKKKCKRRRSEGKKKSEDECFRCGDGGQLVLCDKKTCTKAYHLSCLNLTKRPFGRWDCPWHHCDICGKNSDAFCQLCPNSFCKAHQEGALHPWPPTGQLCCLEHEDLEDTNHQEQTVTTETMINSTTAAAVSCPLKASRKSEHAEAKNKGPKRKAAEA